MKSIGVNVFNLSGSIVPLGVGAERLVVAHERSWSQLSSKSPKLLHAPCSCDSSPDIVRSRYLSSEIGVEPSRDNISVLNRVVEHLLWCSATWLNIRVVAANIKASRVPEIDASAEIHESVEMNAAISVVLSTHETLSWV